MLRPFRIGLAIILLFLNHEVLFAAITERIPGMRIEFPDSWQVGREMQDAAEIAHVNKDGEVDARLTFQTEARVDAEEAITRASQIISQQGPSWEFILVNAWPVAIQRVALPLPKRHEAVGHEIPAFRHTIVAVVGTSIYTGAGWSLRSAPDEYRTKSKRFFLTSHLSKRVTKKLLVRCWNGLNSSRQRRSNQILLRRPPINSTQFCQALRLLPMRLRQLLQEARESSQSP